MRLLNEMLPSYTPYLNPIRFLFSSREAYVRRDFHELWPLFKGTFGGFLEMPVKERVVVIA